MAANIKFLEMFYGAIIIINIITIPEEKQKSKICIL